VSHAQIARTLGSVGGGLKSAQALLLNEL
jgi:hypothetical protein